MSKTKKEGSFTGERGKDWWWWLLRRGRSRARTREQEVCKRESKKEEGKLSGNIFIIFFYLFKNFCLFSCASMVPHLLLLLFSSSLFLSFNNGFCFLSLTDIFFSHPPPFLLPPPFIIYIYIHLLFFLLCSLACFIVNCPCYSCVCACERELECERCE